ncbi:DUF3068 domain-containing protein [Nocardia sp. CNY236]|uniref:DUF3068 domain-containing protein n=1 Tax=Nocardia sp. CNY236 TaxID=1169152 RepID=UPI0003F649AF|nr:DUF3068 domain-containing protein [Nocardia sp. CNY236]
MAPSAGTRRTVACSLIGLGAFLIVAAVLIPSYTVDKVAKTPLDLEITTIATNPPGEDSLVLDATSLAVDGPPTIDRNVPLVSQRFVTVEDPADADKMTVQMGQTLRRTDKQLDTGLLSAAIDRVTISRTTGMPVDTEPNGSIALTVNSQGQTIAEPVQHTGLQYRFPIGTEKKTYPYFDFNVRKTFDIEFLEETEINNLTVYHFRMSVPPTSLWDVVQSPRNRVTLPAAKWGLEGDAPVTMIRYYTNTRDLFVEPQTGALIKGSEKPHLYYSRTADEVEVTALKSHLVMDDKTVESQMSTAKKYVDQLSLYGRILPIVAGILGAIAVIAGVLLGIRGGGPGPMPARPGGGPSRPGGTAPIGGAPPERVGPGADDMPTEQIPIHKQP